jgi:acyl carrier protein
LDDEFIEALLTTRKDSPECFPILSLIYSHLDFKEKYHKDHLHCASYFRGIKREDFQTDEEFNFYSDPSNWDSIVNLQLLNDIENMSKGSMPLEEWVNEKNIDKSNKFIPDVSLKREDFKTFIEKRKELLKTHLKIMVT